MNPGDKSGSKAREQIWHVLKARHGEHALAAVLSNFGEDNFDKVLGETADLVLATLQIQPPPKRMVKRVKYGRIYPTQDPSIPFITGALYDDPPDDNGENPVARVEWEEEE